MPKKSSARSARYAFATALIVGTVICGAPLQPAMAQDKPCSHFDWPLDQEQTWFQSDDLPVLASAQTVAVLPERGFVLTLQPLPQVPFPNPPSRPDKVTGGYGGFLSISAPAQAGAFIITLASESWVDIYQGGVALVADARTRDKECPTIRKSLRFTLAAKPFVLQLASVPGATVKVAIRPVN